MKRALVLVMLVFEGMVSFVGAQDTKDEIHLFQGFFRDAPITQATYIDGGIAFASYEYLNTFAINGQGGYALNEKVELGAAVGFLNWSPEYGDSQSGLQDLFITGRYNIVPGPTKISAGGYVTLPIGSEDVYQSHFNFGGYGAVRHPLSNGMVITGTLGLDFLETTNFDGDTEYETSFLLGGGLIYPYSEQINIIGELQMQTEGDYMLLSGGADYKMSDKGRVRGAIGLGLDDGAPDFLIMGSYLFNL